MPGARRARARPRDRRRQHARARARRPAPARPASVSTSRTRCCDRARERFAGDGRRRDPRATISTQPLPADLGQFDVVVSSFAIHHLAPARQRALYGEVFDDLAAGWRLRERRARRVPDRRRCTRSSSPRSDAGPDDDDPSNQLVPVETASDLVERVRVRGLRNAFGSGGNLPLLRGRKPADGMNGAPVGNNPSTVGLEHRANDTERTQAEGVR